GRFSPKPACLGNDGSQLDCEMLSWLIPCIQHELKRFRFSDKNVRLILCIADHFEPRHGATSLEHQRSRVRRWVDDYPANLGHFRDSDGVPPQHTFFFPLDEYEADHVDALSSLCRSGFGEIEFQLHHDDDTSANLRYTLDRFKGIFVDRHGLLAREHESGLPRFGFVHDTW